VRLLASSTLNFANIYVSGSGTLRLGQAATNGNVNVQGTLLVNAPSTLWVDLVSINANNFTTVPAPSSTTNSSYLKFSVNGSQPYITSTYAIYGGGAIIYLSNYNPTSQTTPFTIVNAGLAAGNVLSPVGGSPGYTYALSRSNQNLVLTITPNSRPTNAPTQSNGPSPPVNGVSKTQVFSFTLLFISVFFYLIFN
jgi:hypothetical protein